MLVWLPAFGRLLAHATGSTYSKPLKVPTGPLKYPFGAVVQAAKARARGYRVDRTQISMIFLTDGKLKMHLPT
jgi:hypothetical protein